MEVIGLKYSQMIFQVKQMKQARAAGAGCVHLR
jgi:hypothetical protein